ncbi:MAG: electron transfer flavoprotein subunit alpha, partial [Planctomycetes bacterium]|nr:electron transfer flavoprotein subunit alpha [Planctomycetota bacterium]
MIDVNRQGEVWVFAEQEEGRLSDVPLELLGKARQLAEPLGVPVAAVLLGSGVRPLADELIARGAEKVYLVEDERLGHYQAAGYAHVLCGLIERHRPQIVLYGATPLGRDLAPTVASRMRCGLTADCTDLRIGDHKVPATGEVHEKLMLQIRPAFGGNIIATIVNFDRWPQMATVREGVMAMPARDPDRRGEIIEQPAGLDGVTLPLRILDTH